MSMDSMFNDVKWEVLPPPPSNPDNLPFVTHKGLLRLGEWELRCYQLNTGQRIFEAGDIKAFFEAPGKPDQ